MAVVLLFWSNVELNRCCIASFSPNFHDSLRWFLTKTPKEKNTTMSFLRTFSGKKTPGTSFASRRPIWGDSEVCFDSRLGRISWDVCRQMSKSRRESFSCEENAGSKKKDSIAMGIYNREKRLWWNFLDIWVNMTPAYMPWKWGILKTWINFFILPWEQNVFHDFCGRKNNSKFEVQKTFLFLYGENCFISTNLYKDRS